MADTVRYLMEAMVPELDDLVARGYMTKPEALRVAAARRDFEYRLKRPSPLLPDFLAYIQHETAVDALVRLRRVASGGKPNAAAGLADRGARRRVHFIYERAVRKFRGDLAVWTAWLAFCAATGADRAASRVAARALALHPRVPALWAAAAAWAYGRGRDPAAARALLQRGLRACPGDAGLWAEYVRLEARYAVALRARRAVLGIGGKDGDEGASDDGDGDADADAPASDGDDEPLPPPVTEAAAPAASSDDAATQAVLDGAVAAVAARGALAALPASVPLRARLLAVLAEVADELPAASDAAGDVYASLGEGALARDAGAAALAARRPLTPFGAGGTPAALAAFQAAAQALPTEAMFDEWLAFVREVREEEAAAAEAAPAPPPPKKARRGAKAAAPPPPAPTSPAALDAVIETLAERAVAAGAASEAVLTEWPRAALRGGRAAAALAATEAAVAVRPASVAVWRARLALVAAAGPEAAGGATVVDVARTGAAAVGRADAWPLLADAAAAATGDADAVAAVCDAVVDAQRGAPAGPPTGGAGAAAAAALAAATATGGADARRTFVERLNAGPSPGGDYWEAVLAVEEGETGDPLPAAARASLFEAATAACPDDARPWLRYLAWLRARGEGGGGLVWRAGKALRGDAAAAFERGAREATEA